MATRPALLLQKHQDCTSLTGELNVLVQRAQIFTGAHGAAIAAMDETTGQICCRARSGSTAPDIGVPVKLELTLTGLCIRNNAALRCDDAETDPRVEKFSAPGLNARSIVVVPVRDNGAVIGVLAVFSAAPCAFTVTHMAILRTMADQIARLIVQRRPNKQQEPGLHPAGTPYPAAVKIAAG